MGNLSYQNFEEFFTAWQGGRRDTVAAIFLSGDGHLGKYTFPCDINEHDRENHPVPGHAYLQPVVGKPPVPVGAPLYEMARAHFSDKCVGLLEILQEVPHQPGILEVAVA